MKPLKATTINSYSTRQLVKHLDRLLQKFEAGQSPYRADWSYNKLLKLDEGAYRYESSLDDRDVVLDAINNTWKLYASSSQISA